METDKLISALAADDIPPARPRLLMRVGLAILVSAGLMVAFWGIRADWTEAIPHLAVIAKQLLPVLLAGILAVLLRPDSGLSLGWLAAFGAAIAVVWMIFAAGGGDVWGNSLWQCLLSIPLMALPVGIALFAGLRHRIEPDSARTGLIAGLLAGATGAAIYAAHCNEDSPAFYLIWYGLAVLICGVAGLLAGRRLLGV